MAEALGKSDRALLAHVREGHVSENLQQTWSQFRVRFLLGLALSALEASRCPLALSEFLGTMSRELRETTFALAWNPRARRNSGSVDDGSKRYCSTPLT